MKFPQIIGTVSIHQAQKRIAMSIAFKLLQRFTAYTL